MFLIIFIIIAMYLGWAHKQNNFKLKNYYAIQLQDFIFWFFSNKYYHKMKKREANKKKRAIEREIEKELKMEREREIEKKKAKWRR